MSLKQTALEYKPWAYTILMLPAVGENNNLVIN